MKREMYFILHNILVFARKYYNNFLSISTKLHIMFIMFMIIIFTIVKNII